MVPARSRSPDGTRGERAEFDEESAALLVAQKAAEYVDDPRAEPDDEREYQDAADEAPAARRLRRR
jgi:hypothetical protein